MRIKMDEAIAELIAAFKAEAEEHLNDIETQILSLENNPDPDIVNTVFRAMHSIKGSAGFLNFIAINELAHSAENSLSKVRDNILPITPDLIDTLLATVDHLKKMLENLEQSNEMDNEELKNKFSQIISNKGNLVTGIRPLNQSEIQDSQSKETSAETNKKADLPVPSQDSKEEKIPASSSKAKEKAIPSPQREKTSFPAADKAEEHEQEKEKLFRIPHSILSVKESDLIKIGEQGYNLFFLTFPYQEYAQNQPLKLKELFINLQRQGNLFSIAFDDLITDADDAINNTELLGDDIQRVDILLTSHHNINELKNSFGFAGLVVRWIKNPYQLKQAKPKVQEDAYKETPLPEKRESSPEPPIDEKPVAREEQKKKPAAATPAEKSGTSNKIDMPKSSSINLIRVSTNLLDKLMNLASELVLVRNRQMQYVSTNTTDNDMFKLSQQLNVVTTELQESIMKTRMQPIHMMFQRFPRLVRDISKNLKKQVDLVLEDNDVELDKSLIEALNDPMVHIIRNSLDHGIETAEERIQKDKPPTGTISVEAYHEAGMASIIVRDDGKGIDIQKLIDTAIRKSIITSDEANKLTEEEALTLIFKPGFSTAFQVNELSGRGVGMDVVRTNIEKLGGTIHIESKPNEGTLINLKLPLTLAIIPSLIIKASNVFFAIPQINLVELVQIYKSDVQSKIEKIKGTEVFRLRRNIIPLVRLSQVLKTDNQEHTAKHKDAEIVDQAQEAAPNLEEPLEFNSESIQELNLMIDKIIRTQSKAVKKDSVIIVVLKIGNQQFGLLVDQVVGTEEIVVKPLHSHLQSCGCYSGETILGNGRVALILDVGGLARSSRLSVSESETRVVQKVITSSEKEEYQSLLLFKYSGEEQFAVPLSLIARVEKVEPKEIRQLKEKHFMTYRGKALQLIHLEQHLPVSVLDKVDFYYVIVPKFRGEIMGIITAGIMDTIQIKLDIDTHFQHKNGILGTFILDNNIVMLIDVYSLMEAEDNRISRELTKTPESYKILLAEDNKFFRELIKSYIEAAKHNVDTAVNGKIALEILKNNPNYDLIISDIEMPEMDGFELIKNIRNDSQLKHLPCIALTSLADNRSKTKAIELGFNEYLLKLDKETLLNAIQNFSKKVKNLLIQG